MKKHLLTLLTSTLIPLTCLGASNNVVGTWQTQKKADENRTAHVKIAPCQSDSSKLCGKIIALEEPIDPETGKPKLDKHNPDESLQNRPVMGLEMLANFEKTDNNTYENGTIYSPRTGKTYDAKLHVTDKGILEVTGYVFFFSSTQEWTKVSK